jgi:hypothetical protein
MEPAMNPRVAPLSAPYPEDVQAAFDRIMPSGVEPLVLFRTLASVPRVWEKFRAGSLLDKGPLDLRQREIVIDRVCARCGCAYEWGGACRLLRQARDAQRGADPGVVDR